MNTNSNGGNITLCIDRTEEYQANRIKRLLSLLEIRQNEVKRLRKFISDFMVDRFDKELNERYKKL